jgi:hypothetical protein
VDITQVEALRSELQAISEMTTLYFAQANVTLGSANICHPGGEWDRLTEQDKKTAQTLRKEGQRLESDFLGQSVSLHCWNQLTKWT